MRRRRKQKPVKPPTVRALKREMTIRGKEMARVIRELRAERAEARASRTLVSIVRERIEARITDLKEQMRPLEEAIEAIDDLDLSELEEDDLT